MKRLFFLFSISFSIIIFSSCTGRFDSMNTNPGAVTNASLKYILPYVQEVGAHLSATPYQLGDNLYAQRYCQYFANTQTAFSTDRYGYNDSWSTGGFWTPYYTTLKHLKVAKEIASKESSEINLYQMMRITLAYETASMTDIYGDIPYTTAGLGESQNKYDPQDSIYKDIFKELTEAVEVLNQNNSEQETVTSDNDLVFGGNIQKWIRFANSLRLRYALRISFKDPSWAKTEGEAALKAGIMESNSDNAYMTCNGKGAWGWGNPLYMMSTWHEFTMSAEMEKILKHLSTVEDPRMRLWFGQAEDYVAAKKDGTLSNYTGEQFAGLPNGMSSTEIGLPDNAATRHSVCLGLQAYPEWNSLDTPTSDVLNTTVTLPLKIMTYSEVCFLKAEAALLGWSGAGNAKENYYSGITASLADERSFLSNAALSPTTNDEIYMTTGDVAWDDNDTYEQKLEKIATQKWIALYPNGIEAWAECRRTGYPKLIPVLHSEETTIDPSKGQFIKKLRYPDSERRENAENATSSKLNNGQGDGPNVRVWWDTGRYK